MAKKANKKSNVSIIGKISVKTVCGKIPVPEDEGDIMRVLGVCTGFAKGESTYGPWVCARGSFKAINLETGAEYASAKCFLPDIAIDLIAVAMSNSESVEFAYDIGVKPSDTPTGYEYTVNPLVKPSANDPVALIEQRLQDSLPA